MHNSDSLPAGNCQFCRNEIIKKSFCSTSQFSAIYNIAPIVPGHSLIIPNTHYISLFELSDQELGEMMVFARKVTRILQTVFQCDGFDWSVQDGISAGQSVQHLHLHIVPRKPHDMTDGTEWYSKLSQNAVPAPDSQHRVKLEEEEYNAITARLTEASSSIQ